MASAFDYARSLARALRESDEARRMRSLGSKLRKEQRLERLLREFRQAQFAIQAAQLQGQNPAKSDVDRFQKLVKQAEGEALLVEYLTAENAYGQLLTEVQEVLAEVFSPDVPGAVRSK